MEKNIRILNIENEQDEIDLSVRSDEIDVKTQNKLVRQIVSDLKKVIKEKNLTSLSAPAIGYKYRIFCINYKDLEIKTFINPIIGPDTKGIHLSKETCTSIPGKKYLVPRNTDLMVMYMTPTCQPQTRQMLGVSADVFQHEMNHLDGIVLDDIGLEIDDDFENATEEERQEIINMYLDSIDMKRKQLEEEIHNNEELKQMSDAIDFMTSVQKGETIIEGYNDQETVKEE